METCGNPVNWIYMILQIMMWKLNVFVYIYTRRIPLRIPIFLKTMVFRIYIRRIPLRIPKPISYIYIYIYIYTAYTPPDTQMFHFHVALGLPKASRSGRQQVPPNGRQQIFPTLSPKRLSWRRSRRLKKRVPTQGLQSTACVYPAYTLLFDNDAARASLAGWMPRWVDVLRSKVWKGFIFME